MTTPNEESNKETTYEGLSDSEELESSEEQEPRKSDEPTTTTPEERGVTVEGQQEQKADSTKEEMRLEPQMEDSNRNLFDQFTKHFKVSKLATDKTTNTLEQIQNTLTHIDKISVGSKKQNMVIKQLVDQVTAIDKQLEKINKTTARLKSTPTTLRKKVRKIKKSTPTTLRKKVRKIKKRS
jgi:hypothetical protein